MSSPKSGFVAFIAGVALTTAAASASSLPINATLFNAVDTPNGVQPGTNVMTVQFGTSGSSGAFVGQLNWHSAGSPGALTTGLNNQELNSILVGGDFSTYCIEGTEDVIFGQTATWADGVVNLSDAPDTTTPATSIIPPSPNSPHFSTQQVTDLTAFWNRFHALVGTDNEKGTAFQLGIWEIVYDDGVGGIAADLAANPITGGNPFGVFGAGTFQGMGDNTATGLAQTWLSNINSAPLLSNDALFALSGPGVQDQIFGVPNGGALPPIVPLPAALPAGLALMSGLGVFKFFRRRA